MIAKSKTGQEIERALDNYKQIKDEIKANPDGNNPDLIKRYLEAKQRLKGLSISVDPISVLEEEIKKIDLQNGFYVFNKTQLMQSTTQKYRDFLKDANYANIDNCSGLGIAKGILRWSQDVRDLAVKLDLKYDNTRLTGNDGEYVVNINQTDGRKLVEGLGGKLLPAQLMYGLFIPYIKQEAQNGNTDAQATLDEMIQTKAEWLGDLVVDQSKLKMGNSERAVAFPQTDGRFDRADLNGFGYPKATKPTGEFYHWFPRAGERAVIRDGGSGLSLGCVGGPSGTYGGLGVRVAKFH